MNLISTFTGKTAKEQAELKPPFGPGLTETARVETLEVYGTSFTDQGDDHCEFRALDAAGTLLATVKVPGY